MQNIVTYLYIFVAAKIKLGLEPIYKRTVQQYCGAWALPLPVI